MRAKIVEVIRVGDRILVAFDLIEGDIAPESILTVEGSDGVWNVVGIKLPSQDLHENGRRGATLKPAQNEQKIEAGDIISST